MSLVFGSICALFLFIFRDLLINTLAKSDDVKPLVQEAFVVIYLNIIFDFFSRSGQGIIQGLGKQA